MSLAGETAGRADQYPTRSPHHLGDVLQVLDLADASGTRLWLDGGWGVDALLGEPTREHGDLDVALEARHCEAFLAALVGAGFAPVGEEGVAPWNFLLSRRLGGREVDCIAPQWVVRFHDRYAGDENDRADVRALCDRFDLEVPEQYR